jgi:hypothetical protein
MLDLPKGGLATARGVRCRTRLLHGHLTSSRYEYGVASEAYITRNWSRYFELQVRGAIHDFQDIVVLLRRDDISTPEPELERLGSPVRQPCGHRQVGRGYLTGARRASFTCGIAFWSRHVLQSPEDRPQCVQGARLRAATFASGHRQ